MALEINTQKNAFEVKGTLDKSNVEKFQNHFKNIFNKTNALVINIDALESIDNSGVSAFEELYIQSKQNLKPFFITGLGCREMFEHLKTIDAA